MGFLKEQQSPVIIFLPLFLFFLFTVFVVFPFVTTAADYTNLVYKGCANQKFVDPAGVYSQTLKSLFQSLVSQSSQKSFFTTNSGQDSNAIMGLYQCRGDLNTNECQDCVSKIPKISSKLCGGAVAARVQLIGCYLRYEVVGFKQVSETDLLYKVCGSIQASGTGFEQKRDTAFGTLENGVKSGGGLFYTGTYESVYVLGQCEGDMSSDDCGDCVKSAVQKATTDCGDAISGQIYLHKCYISYSYYPNGVPNISAPSGKVAREL